MKRKLSPSIEKLDKINGADTSFKTKKPISDIARSKDYQSNLTSPLHLASEKGCEQSVSLLIKYGFDVNSHDHLGKAPLHLCTSGKVAELLLKAGAHIHDKRSNVQAALHFAAESGYEDVVSVLIRFGADVNQLAPVLDETALHRTNSEKIARLLLEAGADVNIGNRFGMTALSFAAGLGNEDLIKVLLEYKANINASTLFDATPLHFARSAEVARLLLENGACVDARTGKEQYGIYLNSNDEETALHLAAKQDCKELVTVLIEFGADVNAVNENAETAIHFAKSQDVIKLLVKAGSDINAKDNEGQTALARAAGSVRDWARVNRLDFYANLVSALIQHGANVNLRVEHGKTALHYAESGEIARLLLAAGAYVNAKDDKGLTALYSAITEHYEDKLLVLLEFGADVISLLAETELGDETLDNIWARDDSIGYILASEALKLAELELNEKNIKTSANLYSLITRDESYSSLTLEEYLPKFRASCRVELEKIKSRKLTKKITLYDVLRTNILDCPSREAMIDILNFTRLKNYPLYGGILKGRILRVKLFLGAERFFKILHKTITKDNVKETCGIPHELQLKVLNYLDDIDIISLIRC